MEDTEEEEQEEVGFKAFGGVAFLETAAAEGDS